VDTSKKNRITNAAGAILVVAALVADLFTLIPLVGDFVGPIFWVLASVYFWRQGMGIVSGKQGVTKIISTIAELIPGVQELPTIFVAMLIIVGTTRLEDKTGISANVLTKGKMGPKMNVEGMRHAPPKNPIHQGDFRPPNGSLPK
jgi:hypothetical protein